MDSRTRLRAWIDRHTNQRRFADDIGVTESYLSQVLAGLRTPRLPILGRIEDQTGIPIRGWLPSTHGKPVIRRGKPSKNSNVHAGPSHV